LREIADDQLRTQFGYTGNTPESPTSTSSETSWPNQAQALGAFRPDVFLPGSLGWIEGMGMVVVWALDDRTAEVQPLSGGALTRVPRGRLQPPRAE
jgi:hypothetical protein